MAPSFVERSSCPACGSGQTTDLFERSFAEPRLRVALTGFYALVGGLDYGELDGAVYRVAACGSCGLVFQRHVPDDRLLGLLYEVWIDPEKARSRYHRDITPAQRLALAQQVAIVAELTGSASPRLALDYGCGWGEWSTMTRAFGFEAWGTELSRSRREHALKAGVRVVDDAELPDRAFGLINLDQVLEHVPEPKTTLRLMAEKLAPGGILRVGVPNGWRIRRALRRFDIEIQRPRLGGLNPVAPLEHLNCFTTSALLHLARTCGLSRVRPRWRTAFRCLILPPGVTGKARALARALALRSNHTTLLFFTRTSERTTSVGQRAASTP